MTTIEWIKILPCAARKKAMRHLFSKTYLLHYTKTFKTDNPYIALAAAFAWAETPQGFLYWNDVVWKLHTQLENNK